MAIGEISSNHLYANQQNLGITSNSQQQVEQYNLVSSVNKPVESTQQQNNGLQSSDQNTAKEQNITQKNAQEALRSDSDKASSELPEEKIREIKELSIRDREVRNHEAAHLAAAGPYAQGGPSYTFKQGPNGKSYAVGGEVKIDTAPIPGDPEATLRKARQIKASALAPAEPSSQDQSVAASAVQLIATAQQELSTERLESSKETSPDLLTKAATRENTQAIEEQQITADNRESQPASEAYTKVADYTDKPTENNRKNSIDQLV